ncbi:MAG: hypothetical protein WD490_00775 [Opitutales bacterium]
MVFIEEKFREKFPGKGNLSFFEVAEYFGIDLKTFRGRSAVVEKEVALPGEESFGVYFKIYSYRKSRWQRFLRRPRTWREVRNLKFFASRCPDSRRPEDAAMRRTIIAQVACGARLIHDRNFFHQDLKWRNLLVFSRSEDSPVVFWIDCPSGYFDPLGANRKRGRIKDLATMDTVARERCSLRERIYFLRSYLGGASASGGRSDLPAREVELAREVDRYRRRRFDDVVPSLISRDVSGEVSTLQKEVSR